MRILMSRPKFVQSLTALLLAMMCGGNIAAAQTPIAWGTIKEVSIGNFAMEERTWKGMTSVQVTGCHTADKEVTIAVVNEAPAINLRDTQYIRLKDMDRFLVPGKEPNSFRVVTVINPTGGCSPEFRFGGEHQSRKQ